MTSLRPRLSFANVMSTIAVFIALGGAAYAATRLPKNSVGARQLKNGSITAAKIKKGTITGAQVAPASLTGAQVDASSLAPVPSALRANTASDAGTLDGMPSGAFAPSNRFLFGTADTSSKTAQVLFTVPNGFTVSSIPSAKVTFKVRFSGIGGPEWDVTDNYEENAYITGSDAFVEFTPPNRVATFVARQISEPSKAVVVDCGSEAIPGLLECWGILSPNA